jgi:hypothetical protein
VISCSYRRQRNPNPAKPTPADTASSCPGEGNNPSVLRSDNAARFAAHLFGDDDTIDGYEPEPPAPWPPRILDTY